MNLVADPVSTAAGSGQTVRGSDTMPQMQARKEDSGDEVIRFGGIGKSYGETTALANIDLSVRKGEFLTLLGPSGSGKSTLLNIVTGAIAPTKGRVFIEGRDVTAQPARERGLAMVFQNYALMPHMSVFENVAFPLKVRRWRAADIRRQVGAVLERVGLSGFESRRPRELSGGQQQRVAIARCLAYSPAIILMDEPLGALDKKLRVQLQSEIKRLHRDLGTTFIYVTHDQEEALDLSDTICLMRAGRIEQLGTPEALYFEPTTTFAADFVGESNLFEGTLEDDGCVSAVDGLRFHIAGDRGVPAGTAVKVLVRPEKMQLDTDEVIADGSALNRLSGIVHAVSFVGGMTRLELRTESARAFIVKTISQRAAQRIRPGATLRVCWSAADTVLLAS
jgi:putative spermidine/putrescine transport system ATP-binding protein